MSNKSDFFYNLVVDQGHVHVMWDVRSSGMHVLSMCRVREPAALRGYAPLSRRVYVARGTLRARRACVCPVGASGLSTVSCAYNI